jgi:hypothetical protein
MQMRVYLCNGRASRLSRPTIVDVSLRIFFDLDMGKDACFVNGAASPVRIAEGETLTQDETRPVGANSDQTAQVVRSKIAIVHATIPGELSREILARKTAPSSCRNRGPPMLTTRGAVIGYHDCKLRSESTKSQICRSIDNSGAGPSGSKETELISGRSTRLQNDQFAAGEPGNGMGHVDSTQTIPRMNDWILCGGTAWQIIRGIAQPSVGLIFVAIGEQGLNKNGSILRFAKRLHLVTNSDPYPAENEGFKKHPSNEPERHGDEYFNEAPNEPVDGRAVCTSGQIMNERPDRHRE